MRFTLTRRVVWAVTATVALLVGLQTVLAFVSVHVQEDELTDSMLRNEVQQLIALTLKPGLMPVGQLQASPRVTAFLTRGDEGRPALPPSLRDLGPGHYQVAPGDATWHVDVVDTEDGRLVVVVDATPSEARVRDYGRILLALWAACTVATVFIARGVARIAVSPFVEATRVISRLAPERPPGQPDADDEAGLLVETFNRFRDRVDETVAREREFAANLDHEIRTPLTTIRTDAELIALEGPVDDAQRRRLERIAASVDEIIATTESMLSPRDGRRDAAEAIDLRECVDTVCSALADRAASKKLRIASRIDAGVSVVADRQALLTVCRNIVRNAIEHAAPATLVIDGDREALRFEDDGPGIDAAALPHVFERFQQGRRADATGQADRRASGKGLGLAIARRVCDLQGWTLSVRSPAAEGHGTAFDLRLA